MFRDPGVRLREPWLSHSEGKSDADEVVSLEGCATDEATVDVRLCKELLGIGWLAGTAVKYGGVVSNLGTEHLGEKAADVGVDFLCLVSGSGLAGSDGPYRLVSDYHLGHILGAEVAQDVPGLCTYDIEVLACLTLLEVLTYAEYDLKTCLESESGLIDELLISLAILLATLGVAEYGVLAT